MDFITSLTSLPAAEAERFLACIGLLTIRERDAILTESRISEDLWNGIHSQLRLLAPSIEADDVRLAFSAALEGQFLTGPRPDPRANHCERAVSYERTLKYFLGQVGLPRSEMEDHVDYWDNDADPTALVDCKGLVGHLLTGARPSWAVPFEFTSPMTRPLSGMCASAVHCCLALYPEVDDSPKMIMTYALPSHAPQAIPTIADAFQWNDDQPFWRYFFLPSAPDLGYGMTAPMDPSQSGFPEIVHEPIPLSHLVTPLQKRL
jgi:hypothetical protein